MQRNDNDSLNVAKLSVPPQERERQRDITTKAVAVVSHADLPFVTLQVRGRGATRHFAASMGQSLKCPFGNPVGLAFLQFATLTLGQSVLPNFLDIELRL